MSKTSNRVQFAIHTADINKAKEIFKEACVKEGLTPCGEEKWNFVKADSFGRYPEAWYVIFQVEGQEA